jgi:hypothetical protein
MDWLHARTAVFRLPLPPAARAAHRTFHRTRARPLAAGPAHDARPALAHRPGTCLEFVLGQFAVAVLVQPGEGAVKALERAASAALKREAS